MVGELGIVCRQAAGKVSQRGRGAWGICWLEALGILCGYRSYGRRKRANRSDRVAVKFGNTLETVMRDEDVPVPRPWVTSAVALHRHVT